jgi:hypothetical protein
MATATSAPPTNLKGGVGAYKELQGNNVVLENELKGTEKFGAASYPE